MHMADALVSTPVAAVMGVASVGALGYSIYKVKTESTDFKKVPLMGVMGAFVFASQMLNFTIPGTNSSGHICGGMLLTALLGPYSAFITMTVILLLQCLIFADGGLMALGCNIWNMAFYACFAGGFLIYRPIVKDKFSKLRIMLASIIGCVVTLQMGSFSVVLETMASGVTELPFSYFVTAMQPIHLAIGAVEGVLTGLVLIFVGATRPEIINQDSGEKKRVSFGAFLAVFAIVTLVFAGGVSLVASNNPDGLEWSIRKVTGSEDEFVSGKNNHEKAADIVDNTSIMADYTVNDSDKPLGTTAAGVIGSLAVAAVCCTGCFIFMKIRKKKITANENRECN